MKNLLIKYLILIKYKKKKSKQLGHAYAFSLRY